MVGNHHYQKGKRDKGIMVERKGHCGASKYVDLEEKRKRRKVTISCSARGALTFAQKPNKIKTTGSSRTRAHLSQNEKITFFFFFLKVP